MYKLTLITLCIVIWQCAFAQNEPLKVEGSIVISDSESANPLAGTIKWTGQDFEGFDGTSWKSLTCGCDDDPNPNTDAILTCPSVDFELDNCNLTVNWTHDNPVSNTVNYDLKLYHVSKPNGVDPGLSVTYPATSNTISICDPEKLGINSGSGSIDVELLYWYDGNTDAIISAGTCTVNYNFNTSENSDAKLSCPASGFIQNGCALTFNWTHDNPLSTNVNYDLRIDGMDSGQPATYPATSNTIDICNTHGITSGGGFFEMELMYWYDGEANNKLSAGVCTVEYELSTVSDKGRTFAEIEAAAATQLPNFCNESDDAYVAEFLYQNPNVVYWEVKTLLNGQKRVVPVSVQKPPNNAIQLPVPSGGDDTAALESVINGNGDNKVFVGSGSYKVNQLDIDKAGTVIYFMKVTPAPGAGELIHINADDVRLINCPQDMQDQGSAYLGVRAEFADRFHLIRSGLTNMYHTGGNSGGGVLIKGCADFHIAGGIYNKIWNPKDTPGDEISEVCRANAFWVTGWNSGGSFAVTDGGYIVNNTAEDIQSSGLPTNGNRDAEFLTVQSNSGHLKPIKVFANRCVDAGKRLLKSQQDGGITVLSNYYEWRTNSTVLGNRTRLAMIAVHFDMGDVIVRNNRLAVNGDRNWGYIMNLASTNKSGTNIHFDCNLIEINNPWNGAAYDQIIFVARSHDSGSTGTDTSQENINCTMNDNTIFGTGGVNYHYWFGKGFDVNSGLLQPSGNTFNLGDSGSPHQGIERKNGPD